MRSRDGHSVAASEPGVEHDELIEVHGPTFRYKAIFGEMR